MPHQCLSCGKIYPEGSTDLLKGCGSCQGTRFFFTEAPLDEGARTKLAESANKDLHTLLQDLLTNRERPGWGKGIWSKDAWEQWVRVSREPNARGLPSASPAPSATAAPARAPTPADREPRPPPAKPAEVWEPPVPMVQRQATLDQVVLDAAPADAPSADLPDEGPRRGPETLHVVEPGRYEIDVDRLLDRSPVIIEKDGVYLVHLPSVFTTTGRKR